MIKYTFFLLLSLIFHSQASALTDPSISWRMIRTQHFRVIYDARQKELAEKYAEWAEASYTINTKHYVEAPDLTTLLILDAFDLANGEATAIPYPLINVFPVLPSPHDNIGTYGNWARELVLHEFTHILSFEPAHGFWRPLRWVFGSIATPNMFLPRWYMEGIAVDIETRESEHGRLRNPYYYAILRAMYEDGQLEKETLARTNDLSNPQWPGGSRAYILGSFLVEELNFLDGSFEIHPYLIERYSARVPYFLTAPLDERLNINYDEAFASLLTRVNHNSQADLNLVNKNGRSPSTKVETRSLEARSPVISPNGKYLAFSSGSAEEDSSLYIFERNDKNVFEMTNAKPIVKKQRIAVQRVSWSPDSKQIVYNAVDAYGRYLKYSDLYIYDLETKKDRQLTRGARASEAAFSPDGSKIAFRRNNGGTTELAQVDREGKNLTVLYAPAGEVRISWPEYVSDFEIIFSERSGGREHLKLMNTKTKVVREALQEYQPQFPRWSSKGLLFSSEKSGISNIYLAAKDFRTAKALTNITSRAISPELDEKTGDLYFTRLNGGGINVERLPAESMIDPAEPPKIELPKEYTWKAQPNPTIDKNEWQDDEYSVWRYMIPRYWYPWVNFVDGGALFSASTSANDPTGQHAYQVMGFYDSLAHIPSWAAAYSNAQTSVPTVMSATDQYQYLFSTGSVIRSSQAFVNFDLATPFKLSTRWSGGGGWEYYRNEVPEYLTGHTERSLVFKRTGPSVYAGYSNLTQKGKQISPEQGFAVKGDGKHYIQNGDFTSYDKVSLSAVGFVSEFLPENHVVMGQLNTILHPRSKSEYLGSLSAGADYQGVLLASDFRVRGYNTGTFLARHVATATAEYRFPLLSIYQGGGTTPLFTRRLHAALVTDVATLDGSAYNFNTKTYDVTKMGREYFWGAGAEIKLDMTIGYFIPLTLIGGFYYGAEAKNRTDDVIIAFGVGYQGGF